MCPWKRGKSIQQYGESYWRRVHQLPGVTFCVHHGLVLRHTNVQVCNVINADFPHRSKAKPKLQQTIDREKALEISRVSLSALRHEMNLGSLEALYQSRVLALGYGRGGTQISGKTLARDFHAYFGPAYLASLGGSTSHNAAQWAEQFATKGSASWTSLRHVLFLVFLASNPTPSVEPRALQIGRKPRHIDWKLLESHSIKVILHAIDAHRRAGTQTTTTDLLTIAGVSWLYRNNADRFETLARVLSEFKSSQQSKHKAGKRPKLKD